MNRLLLILLLVLSSCNSSDNRESKLFSVGNNESIAFLKKLEYSFSSYKAAIKNNTPADSLKQLTNNLHRSLSSEFPISYDWWLQDGERDKIDWYCGETLKEEITKRLNKHNIDNNFKTDLDAISTYIEKCTDRRRNRLIEISKKNNRVVFTKFKTLRPSFFAYTEALSDARDECFYFAGSQLAVLHINELWATEQLLLSDSLGVFRDPDVHFDGDKIVFAWKKSLKEDDFHLYEYNFNNQTTRQITFGLGHADIEPIYLPDDNILFNSTRCGNSVDCWTVEVSNLYLCNRDGEFMRQVGFDQVQTPHPVLLDDGRVVYTRWDYNDRGQLFTQPLFQMNPDGTGQSEYYGVNSFFPTTLTHAAPIPGSSKIMATATGHHTPQHGKLCIVDIEAGRNEEEGVLMIAPQSKPKPVQVDLYGQYGEQFQYPHPITEDQFLISYTPLGYHTGHPMFFGIYWMNIDGDRELLIADSDKSCNQPMVLKSRKRAQQRASTVDYTKDSGLYYMQNIYAGQGLEGVEKGTIKKLRIVELKYRSASIGAAFGYGGGGAGHAFTPVGVGNTSWDIKVVHGTVDVYEDGSAFFSVPARKPLYFQALDQNGRVVQTMRSWSTLMPNEMQSCVGCHEHKNSVPLSAHHVSIAMNRGVQPIKQDSRGVRAFSYQKEVQPILNKHCISCHDGVKNSFSLKGDLKVVENQTKRKFAESYLNLTHARKSDEWNDSWQGDPYHKEVNWISSQSRASLLKPYHAGSNSSNIITRLERGHGNTSLDKSEISIIAMWIDLSAPFISDYKEANNWSQEELDYYDYYQTKREQAQTQERQNINDYINYLNKLKR